MVDVRRMLTLGAAWAVAAAFAAVVAWQGVGLVGDQVTDERPPTTLGRRGGGGAGGHHHDRRPPARPPLSAPAAGVTEPTGPAHDGRAGARARGPVVPRHRRHGGARLLPPAGVTVAYAAPDLGYQIALEADDGGWRIEFEGPAGRSRIEGWWDGGPQDRVEDAAGTPR